MLNEFTAPALTILLHDGIRRAGRITRMDSGLSDFSGRLKTTIVVGFLIG